MKFWTDIILFQIAIHIKIEILWAYPPHMLIHSGIPAAEKVSARVNHIPVEM